MSGPPEEVRQRVLDTLASSGVDAGGSPAGPAAGAATNVAPEGAEAPPSSDKPAASVPEPAPLATPEKPGTANGGGSLPAIFHGTPLDVIQQAHATAKALASVIAQRKLYITINDKAYVYVEAWTLCGSMVGVFPIVEWCRRIESPPDKKADDTRWDGWEARVTARTLAGHIVGAAESQCTRHETKWRNRDDFALRSMAETRAVSKALRLPLGFIVQLAGYNPTPAEEMNSE